MKKEEVEKLADKFILNESGYSKRHLPKLRETARYEQIKLSIQGAGLIFNAVGFLARIFNKLTNKL